MKKSPVSNSNNPQHVWQERYAQIGRALRAHSATNSASGEQLSNWFSQLLSELQRNQTGRDFLLKACEGHEVDIASGVAHGLKWKLISGYPLYYPMGHADGFYQAVIASVLNPGDVLYDIGANAGFHSLVGAAVVGTRGKVYAFEADSDICSVVQQQFQINSLNNCEVIEAAVSTADGEIKFYPNSDNGLGSLVPDQSGGWGEPVIVKSISLDSFSKDHPKPTIIKIDVEGAEADVAEGARGLLEDNDLAPVLFIEIHTPEAAEAINTLLTSMHYKIYTVGRMPNDKVVIVSSELNPSNIRHVVASKNSDARLPGVINFTGSPDIHLAEVEFR